MPYGVYDPAANAGWVGVGVEHDATEFAVWTIRGWWRNVDFNRYAEVRYLTITANGGGSNSLRVRLWKCELQTLANEPGIDINVHQLPPGTSRRNKIEQRRFSFIGMSCRANSRKVGFLDAAFFGSEGAARGH